MSASQDIYVNVARMTCLNPFIKGEGLVNTEKMHVTSAIGTG